MSTAPSLGTKLAYGFGSVAYGVKNNGFDYFLVIFYSQVLGVDAPLVGLALLIALMFDAFSDPLVGYFSDNTHSRWGRRHPYMYAAALPVAVSYYFLWNPPAGLTGNDLFWPLVVLSILIRTLITVYEVPSSALAAELSTDYDQRTSLLSFRYFFGWVGGIAVAVISLRMLLVPTDDIPSGFFNIEGYGQMGLMAAIVIFAAILISALGTHGHIPHLKAPPARRPFTPKRAFREIFETLANRSFVALFLAALFGAVSTGLAGSLNYYLNTFFWEFTAEQTANITASVVISAVIAFIVAPMVSRTIGKKKGAIIIGGVAFAIAPLPVALRLLDLLPANHDPALYPIILVLTVLDVALIIAAQILMASMIADIVEDSEIRTSRRSEGIFFASITFTRKFVQGFGTVTATMILTAAQFPKQAQPGQIPEDVIFNLGAYYAPTIFIVWMLMIACLGLYRIDRSRHEANLRTLAEVQRDS